MGFIDLAQNRDRWPDVVNAVMNGFHTMSHLLAFFGKDSAP